MLPVLLTTAEVADIFRVDAGTVTQWVREGRIAALKSPGGGAYRFHRSEVEKLLKASSASPDLVPSEPEAVK